MRNLATTKGSDAHVSAAGAAGVRRQPPGGPGQRAGEAARAGEAVRTVAAVLLLACVVGRACLGEMPFRTSQLRFASPQSDAAAGSAKEPAPISNRSELSRMTFAVLVLAAWALWLLGAALTGTLVVRHGYLAWLILIFAGLSLVSALSASDKRGALDGWVEQVSMMGACFLAAQACGDRRWFGLMVIVLAATGGVMAMKGLWQVIVSVPQGIADFDLYRAERLRQLGVQEGSPHARLLEGRIRNPALVGFFGLANPFASLLIVLLTAAAGLTVDKIVAAVKSPRPPEAPLRGGEIHLPTLAAALTAGLAVIVAPVLMLTRSRGGIIAGLAALLGGAAVLLWRGRLAAHWRRNVIVAAAVFLLGLGATTCYGLAKDRLPTRTMTIRWYYWTGSARIIAERPLLGVGPANFDAAYLRHRRAAAEEAVKDPHNVIMHALAQYGLPGGACYLAILAALLAGMCRPREGPWLPSPRQTSNARTIAILAVLAAAPLAARAMFSDACTDPILLVLDAVIPAMVLAIMLVTACWAGTNLAGGAETPAAASRIALACGAAGFVLHGMVEINAWTPGAAMAFWVAAGGCLSAAGGGRPLRGNLSALRWPLAALAIAAAAAAQAVLAWPVIAKTAHADEMVVCLAKGDVKKAMFFAEQAARADELDGLSAADAARLSVSSCPQSPTPAAQACLTRAMNWARIAMNRDPANPTYVQLAGDIAWFLANPDSFAYAWDRLGAAPKGLAGLRLAVLADPAKASPLSDLAGLSFAGGDYEEATRLCRRAVKADRASPALHVHLGDAAWLAAQHDAAGAAALRQEAGAAWQRAGELAARPLGPVQTALEYTARAVNMNPMDLRLRMDYARRLCLAGEKHKCLDQVRLAEEIDRSLFPQSAERFSPAERQDVELLKARAQWTRESLQS